MAKKISHAPPRSSKAPLKVSRTFAIQNDLGLHARAAALFVKSSSRYRSEIMVAKGGNEVNGKSIMGILMLAAGKGSQITIRAHGDDASEAVEALGDLVKQKFGEK